MERLAYIPYAGYRQVRWLLGDRSPFGATLKLTTRCTLNCRHCPWLESETDDLPADEWKQIIREVFKLGARHLVMEGGEPTLRDDLQELISFARGLGMKVTVATNCTRPLDRYSPDRYLVSIDGLEEIHDHLRGPGAFKRLIKNLPTAKAERIALVSLSKENADQIEDVLSFFSGRVEGFWFSFVYDYGGKESLSLGAPGKKKAAAEILGLFKRYPIINKPSYLNRVGTSRECRDWLLYTVTADGVIHKGCMIEAIDECRCDQCELACHREFSDFIDPRLYSYHLWNYLKKP
jgi:MoaA/NifB/PqqE/SkfB family radical SAM enzyme